MRKMVSEWLNTNEIIDTTAKKPCHRLGWCPYGKLIEEFPTSEESSNFTCEVFHHDCPVFYHIENTSEKYGQEEYEKEIDIIYNTGGLKEVFSEDKIAEYWYKIGSAHSDDDSELRLQYSIEKSIKQSPNLKEILQELKKIFSSVSLKEIYEWQSQK